MGVCVVCVSVGVFECVCVGVCFERECFVCICVGRCVGLCV